MMVTRLFSSDFSPHSPQLTLTKGDLHHIQNVCHAKEDDFLEIATQNTIYTVQIKTLSKFQLTAKIISQSPIPTHHPQFALIQALPKGDKMGDILRKCTEVGCQKFIPIHSTRSIPQLTPQKEKSKQDRWHSILKSAAMQSRQTGIPTLCPITSLQSIPENPTLPPNALKLLFWEEEKTPLKQVLHSCISPPQHIIVLIGPEGGLCKQEVSFLQKSGFQSVSMGNTILRVENAGLVALGQIQYHFQSE